MFDDSEKRKMMEFLKLLKCLDRAVDFLKKQLPAILFPEFDSFVDSIPSFDGNILHKCRTVLDDLFNGLCLPLSLDGSFIVVRVSRR